MTKGWEIVRQWQKEDGTASRLAELINEALIQVNAIPPPICTGVGRVPSGLQGAFGSASTSMYSTQKCDICGQVIPVDGYAQLTLHAFR